VCASCATTTGAAITKTAARSISRRQCGHVPRPTLLRNKRSLATSVSSGNGQRITYKDAGVDIDAGNELVSRIKKLSPEIGGFSGLFPFGDSFLVAGTDGVGTKLRLAFEMDKHDTIGIDLVAMSVNDIICCGAKPLFFLDYFATSHLDVDKAEMVIKGIVNGCKESGCILLGGETAEMPSFYADGEYDLSGFAVGSVGRDSVIDGSRVQQGDKIIGLPSSGIHSNGFSLVRKILSANGLTVHDKCKDIGLASNELTIGDVLLKPTVLYVDVLRSLINSVDVRSVTHVTGEGLPGNIPRVIPQNMMAQIELGSWEIPSIFSFLQERGNVPSDDLFRTFNMGIGMVVIVPSEDVDKALKTAGPGANVIGTVENFKGNKRVELVGRM